MKMRMLVFLGVFAALISTAPSYSLVKVDDGSIDLAIKYGLKMKGTPTRDILGTNWINDGTGRILNIYSPFIQIAVKSTSQETVSSKDEDIKNVKKRMVDFIDKVKSKNEIRFIVSLYGDNEDFARKYKGYIIDPNTADSKIKPKKSSEQKLAERDGFHPSHPFSAVNCYIFKFDDLVKLKDYYFVLVSDRGEEIKYKISNDEIF